jgi:two-component system, cell cycle response regulator DivK
MSDEWTAMGIEMRSTIEAPRREVAPRAGTALKMTKTGPAGRPVILVVEDNPHDWEIYGKILWYNGFDCVYAVDGAAGLKLAEQHPPDLIVLDVSLPDIDGVELCRRLRAAPGTAETPVIFLTASPASGYRKRAAAAGCAEYIEKPARPVDVLHAVEAIVGQAPQAGEGRPPRLREGAV